jgi:hypothetical protein
MGANPRRSTLNPADRSALMRPGCGTLYGNTAVQKCYEAEGVP